MGIMHWIKTRNTAGDKFVENNIIEPLARGRADREIKSIQKDGGVVTQSNCDLIRAAALRTETEIQRKIDKGQINFGSERKG